MARKPQAPRPKPALHSPLVERHSDLILDFATSISPTAERADRVWKSVVLQLGRKRRLPFRRFETAQVLRMTLDELRGGRHGGDEKIGLYDWESAHTPEQRLEKVVNLVRRLPVDDQFLVWAKTKHQLKSAELAPVFNRPPESLDGRAESCFNAISAWVWPDSPPHVDRVVESLRKVPKSKSPHPIDLQTLRRRQLDPAHSASTGWVARWRLLPGWVRNLVESFLVSALIAGVLLAGPKLRTIYEKNIQKRLQSFDMEELAADPGRPIPFQVPVPGGGGATSTCDPADVTCKPVQDESNVTDDAEGTEAVAAESESNTEEQAPEAGLKVGASEIWRFSLRGENLREVRSRVVRLLASKSPDAAGLEAPGGVQFNLLVPQDQVLTIMKGLRLLAEESAASSQVSRENAFTWFRNASKTPIPAGQTRVIIWISQL